LKTTGKGTKSKRFATSSTIIAGRLIVHARTLVLKVQSDCCEMMLAIRQRIMAEAAEPT